MIEINRVVRYLTLVLLITGAAVLLRGQSDVEELKLTVGRSVDFDYPADISRISTSAPEVVDAVAVTTREFLLHAKSTGTCTVIVWAKTGQRTIYTVNVEQNLEPVRKLIKETFPSEDIHVQSARDSISLTGMVSTQAVSDRAMALVAPSGKSVVNNLQLRVLPVEKQILLRVRFAQLDRTQQIQLGVNLISTGAGNTIARVTTGQFPAPTITSIQPNTPGVAPAPSAITLSDALNVFAFRPDLNLAALIKALQAEGVLQILAEPNLVTTNGKEASFLVGGEFPVPVLQGGANSGGISVMFREFGIRLTFTPTMTANKTIKLYVKPEVSTIDVAHGVVLNGFQIPALATRKMETNIELAEGQSFVIGGLIDDRVTETMSKVPGLSHIPILGVLFKTKDEQKTKTELVVMVTPEIVQPLLQTDPKPMPDMPRPFMKDIVKPQPKTEGAKDKKSKSAGEDARKQG